jgi:ADP-L-glycero-D-manno-heptose 6-epimerase
MIVVTGAAGFIGSVLVKHLNDLGHQDLVLVDDFGTDNRYLNLRGLKYSEFINIDNFFAHHIWKAPVKIEAIYHMGACSDTTELNMDFLLKNNVHYTNQIFELCSKHKIPVCYASSAATYGSGENGYDDDHKKIEKLRPLNKYGYSKQLSDEWVLSQKKTPPKWFGVKFFNVYGPQEYHKGKMSSVVFQAFNQIKTDGKVKLFKSYKKGFKDGEQLRDFVYVVDVVKAMVGLINSKAPSGIYNLGTGHARSFHDLVKATFKAMDKKPNIEFIEMPNELKNQYQYFTEAKMKKLHLALPKFKFHSLEEGISDYVKNYLNNEHQYMDINGKKI